MSDPKGMLEAVGHLIDEQYKLLEEVDVKIIDNVIEFHQTNCENATPECEMAFLGAFIHMFHKKIKESGGDITMPLKKPPEKTHLKLVDPPSLN